MEEIRNTAQIYYETVTDDVKRSVVALFNEMDSDKDGKVSLAEFATFMREGGYVAMNNPTIFEKINKKKNGKLDFKDVKTLFYILVSGRPLCDGCRDFIEGTYFTCVECFTKAQSFCLHPRCFRKQKYDHKPTHSHFLDNYALLEFIRHNGLPARNKLSEHNQSKPRTIRPLEIVLKPPNLNQSTSSTLISATVSTSSKSNKSKQSSSTPLAIVRESNKSKQSSSTPLAIVPIQQDRRPPKKAPLELALAIAANIAVISAALAQCTIM